jgi:ATP-dependent exoDNAse (exonuclease V) alpha subunit
MIDVKVRLPHDYVESHVELGYATTAARAQGRTVDTTHVLVDATMTRDGLYVATTRGRTGAHLYVQTEQLLEIDADRPPAPTTDAKEELVAVLGRETGERTATEIQREGQAVADEMPRRRRTAAAVPTRKTPLRAPARQL